MCVYVFVCLCFLLCGVVTEIFAIEHITEKLHSSASHHLEILNPCQVHVTLQINIVLSKPDIGSFQGLANRSVCEIYFYGAFMYLLVVTATFKV